MEEYSSKDPQGKDPYLWEIAKKRASFRGHLATYMVINGFFWIIWFFSGGRHYDEGSPLPWPVWPMLGWGIGIVFHYLGAYVFPKENSAEEEYQKLLKEKNKQ
jgi:hypothetical protein